MTSKHDSKSAVDPPAGYSSFSVQCAVSSCSLNLLHSIHTYCSCDCIIPGGSSHDTPMCQRVPTESSRDIYCPCHKEHSWQSAINKSVQQKSDLCLERQHVTGVSWLWPAVSLLQRSLSVQTDRVTCKIALDLVVGEAKQKHKSCYQL